MIMGFEIEENTFFDEQYWGSHLCIMGETKWWLQLWVYWKVDISDSYEEAHRKCVQALIEHKDWAWLG